MNTPADNNRRMQTGAARLFSGIGLLLLASCAAGAYSGFRVNSGHRDEIVSKYLGQELVLTSSLHTGDFYGDNSRRFADARPADIIDLYEARGDRVTVPTLGEQVVLAGTPVKITRILFPGDGAQDAPRGFDGDMPTAHTWVVVKPVGDVEDKRPIVLFLGRDIYGPEALVAELNARFASPEWVLTWLSQRDAEIAAHIQRKSLLPGMSTAEMVAAVGQPRNAEALKAFGIVDFVADYGNLHVKVRGGLIASIVDDELEALKAAEREREREQRLQERHAEERRVVAAAEAARIEKETRAREAAEKKAALALKIAEKKEALAQRLADRKAAAERVRQERKEAKRRAREERIEAQQRALARLVDKKRVSIEAEIAELEDAKRWVESELHPVIARAEIDLDSIIETEVGTADYTHKLGVAESLVLKARTDLNDQINEFDARIETAQWRLTALEGKIYGIRLETVPTAAASRIDPRGALVIAVEEGPAEAAGIRPDDIIIRFNYKPVTGPEDLAKRVAEWPSYRAAHVELRRGKTRIKIALEPLRKPMVASR